MQSNTGGFALTRGRGLKHSEARQLCEEWKFALTRGRGLKQPSAGAMRAISAFALTRGRGLKPKWTLITKRWSQVRPHARAWIETDHESTIHAQLSVRPHARAWIETSRV